MNFVDLYLIIKLIFLLICFYFFNKACINNKIFLSNIHISKHKKFVLNKLSIPVSGGVFLLFGNMIMQKNFFLNFYNYFYLIIFIIGICADISKYLKPFLRIVAQVIVVFLFVYIFNILITDVRIPLFNFFLDKKLFSILFTVFSIIVFINGSNLVDGVNLSATSYFLLIFSIIYILSDNNNFFLDKEFIKIQIYLLVIILFFNLYNKSFLGDSGVYFLSLIFSVVIIDFVNNNRFISPYFAVLLLWYPCFENLFSIIRRLLKGNSVSEPDNEHLHHFLYLFFKKKKFQYANNITGLIIFSFNIFVFFFAYKFYNNTKFLILILVSSILTYLLSYIFLKKLSIKNF